MIYSGTGLQQKLSEDTPAGGKRVRVIPAAKPKRNEGIWQHVTIVKEHHTSPNVQCNFCGHKFTGGKTRISEHLCKKC